jgi:hypothetical protein
MEHASRCILHGNMTAHLTVQWTLQQLREAIRPDHRYRSPSVLFLLLLHLHLQLLTVLLPGSWAHGRIDHREPKKATGPYNARFQPHLAVGATLLSIKTEVPGTE